MTRNRPVTSKWSLCKIAKVWNLTTSVTGPSRPNSWLRPWVHMLKYDIPSVSRDRVETWLKCSSCVDAFNKITKKNNFNLGNKDLKYAKNFVLRIFLKVQNIFYNVLFQTNCCRPVWFCRPLIKPECPNGCYATDHNYASSAMCPDCHERMAK